MRKRICYIILIFSLLQNGCERSQKRGSILDQNAPKVVEAHGYVVPKDSVAAPRVTLAGKPKIVPAGKPEVVLTSTNVHPAGIPRVVIAGKPKVCTPGQDSFSLPKTVPAIDNPFLAGIPEVGEAYTKEQNPQDLSSFVKLRGLKGDVIHSLLEDKSGNLWINTGGNGLSKYDGKNFTHFTVKEGLSNNYIESIWEDKNSNLWIGTSGFGVIKYDGESFTNYAVKEGLSDNNVWSIYEDKSGVLWFGTGGGVSKYDGKNFTHYTVKEGLSNNKVLSIYEDKNDNLWFGTEGGGVNRYDRKSFSRFTVKEGLSDNNVLSIYEDKIGNLWFGTGGGVNRYDRKSFTHFTVKEGLSNNVVTSIQEDKSGNLWFGTEGGGINRYDSNSFTHFTDKEGPGNNAVKTILKDKRGNLWFGTDGGGVSKYNGNSFTHFTVKEGVGSILEDKKGNLWFSTGRAGVSTYNGNRFTHFTEKEGLIGNTVLSMLADKSGNLWFSTYEGVSEYNGKSFTNFTGKEGLGGDNVYSMLQDKSGNIWFGTFEGGVTEYDGRNFTYFTKKEGLSNNIVLSMAEDSGKLWFGNYGGGLSEYDGKSFTHFTQKEGLSDNFVQSLLEDNSGNLWIGSSSGGVSRYDGKSFTHFTQKEGLSDNSVNSIIEDKSGNLWFGTDNGLSKLEKNSLATFNKTKADEAGSGLINSGTLFKTYKYEDGVSFVGTMREAKDGTIWIASGGLTAFHPGEETNDTIAPNIQLTDLTLYNENIGWQNLMSSFEANHQRAVKDTSIVLGNGVKVHNFHFDKVNKWHGVPENLSLAYDNNYLTFQFVGITIQSPKKVKYQYKLEGLDENWSALTNRSEATYGNLPHGKYTFKVKAMNGDGYWSKEFNYSFTIRPPWWRTWWAYTLFALAFAGIIYALFRYRLNKIRMQHEIVLQKHKASELEMQALRAQMNPHFIFNSLNSINMFILENNKLQASEYLSKFSRLVRLILQNSQEALVPLERELEALQLYLELESLRFENKFEYKISVDDEVDTTVLKVPPLVIQPYAENAIWHGLMHKKEKGHLEIELYQHEEVLFCKITDDGVGRKKAAELKSKSALTYKSAGMHITASRIALLQQRKQNEASISINDLVLPNGKPAGTEVLIKIPLSDD